MTLSTLQTQLDNLGFNTTVGDGVLAAGKERGNKAWEITVDSGGGCLVVKKEKIKTEKKELEYKNSRVPIVCETVATETLRVQLENASDFKFLEKEISEE